MEMATHPKAEILLNSDNQVTIHSLNDKHTYSLKDQMPMTPKGGVSNSPLPIRVVSGQKFHKPDRTVFFFKQMIKVWR